MLDVRHQNDFVLGHVPRSIFIGLNGGFAPWVGALIKDTNQPLLLIVDEDRIDTVTSIPASALEETLAVDADAKVIDVRKESEYLSEHIVSAENFPLSEINSHLSELPTDSDFFVHCAGGYRSIIASSILKSRGIHNLIDVSGGMAAIREVDISLSDYVCPSTL